MNEETSHFGIDRVGMNGCFFLSNLEHHSFVVFNSLEEIKHVAKLLNEYVKERE